ncbi:apolipoprotein(a)-like [Cheilinus undulatus]|uniref:apolipoprotein(a)-like n=1 Tax=Cheilinus undulatus TaxID=241271 RepID=UPI001BD5905C|nr:apolipoprotein(a)-like [Cheilinus undulatus]XP_041635048.1 apolipoprotein(a)-like [Cheilinus undulatus]
MDLCKAAFLLGALICCVSGDEVDGFTRNRAAWILSEQKRLHRADTVADCAAKCNAEESFRCRAFMFEEMDHECWIAAGHTAKTVPHRDGVSLYDRVEECLECTGETYRGKVSTTESGLTCQRWDSQEPHKHKFNTGVRLQNNLEENYCRNPDNEPRPWCYTTDPDKRWDFCPIPRCTREPPAIVPELTCATGSGKAYRGTIDVTESGKTCQRWSDQTPHEHRRTSENYPCKGLDKNYCRNPGNDERPWCYTTDPETRWEYCSVPSCGPEPEECFECTGESYRGKLSTTESGLSCQRWDVQEPHNHDYDPSSHPVEFLEENYCRNPSGDPRPWCYTTDPEMRWEYCTLPSCTTEPPAFNKELTCTTGVGEAYRGTMAVTESGKTCQRWSDQAPHRHDRTPDKFPCKGLEHNYCRNPDKERGPWCYTTDPETRWEYCNVPSCGPDSEECMECNGENYRGKVSTTESGYTCQSWASQEPHKHGYNASGCLQRILEANYCRNPSGESRPWCYTTNPQKRWEFCTIPRCKSELPPVDTELTCITGTGKAYRGTVAVTASGKTCQRWWDQAPHKHDRTPENYPCTGLGENFCRNPDNAKKPWCYTTDPGTRWEYCSVPTCEPDPDVDFTGDGGDCYEGDGSTYRGNKSETISGRTCQAWSSMSPHSHKTSPEKYPKADLRENLCRNPDGDVAPWCLTTDPEVFYEYCKLKKCSFLK